MQNYWEEQGEDYKEKDMLNFVSMICAIYTKYYI